ncbi:MAG: FtsX-like permease family protein, partial [Gemmatimonadota bacterium]
MIDALRLYWGTGLLLVAGAALALLAVLPISSLAERWSLVPRLGIETQHLTSMGFHWSANASTPADAERLGVQHLFLQLFISGMATLILSALTILSISAARASARTTEIAVRRAVGGSRRALFGSALVEGFAVAAVALMLGGVLGMLAARLAATSWPGSILHGRPSPNFAIVLVLAAILLIGTLFQLLTTTRKRVTEVPPKPLELYIPVVQLAMGLTVLTASALIIRHARAVIESGRLTADDGIVYSTDSPETSSEARSHRYQSLLTRLHQAPQVTTASLTSPGTTAGLGMVDAAMTDCGRCSDGGIPLRYHSVFAVHQFVSADTFSAVNLPVIAGRGISSSDTWESPPVAVVSKGMASRHFQEG